MKTDRTTKILLAAIALGLWANLLGHTLQPAPAAAQSSESYLARMTASLESIDKNIERIHRGTCTNSNLC